MLAMQQRLTHQRALLIRMHLRHSNLVINRHQNHPHPFDGPHRTIVFDGDVHP